MGVDKSLVLEYDLGSINEEQAAKLVKANEEVIKSAEAQKPKGKKPSAKITGDDTTADKKQKKQKQDEKKKIEKLKKEQKEIQSQLKDGVQNPRGFVMSALTKHIPHLSAIIAGTGIIISLRKKIAALQSKFIEDVDKRVNLGISNAEQARIDANLQQIIFQNSDGSMNPRNIYNSFNESDANISSVNSNRINEDVSGFD